VFKLNGAGITLQESTADGRYLTFYSQQLGGNIEFALPLSGDPTPSSRPLGVFHSGCALSPDIATLLSFE